AISASAVKLQPRTHRADAWACCVASSVVRMCSSESLWHEGLHRKSQQFGPRVSENSFDLRIHLGDLSVFIGYRDRVRRKFKEVFKQSLRLLQCVFGAPTLAYFAAQLVVGCGQFGGALLHLRFQLAVRPL